jgi:hypothetical protein
VVDAATTSPTLDPSATVGVTFGVIGTAVALFGVLVAWRQLKQTQLLCGPFTFMYELGCIRDPVNLLS